MAEVNERRRLYLDRSPGETRGAVFLRGRPERLLIERAGVDPCPRLGETRPARLRRADAALGIAFVDLGDGPDAVLPLPAVKGLSQGAPLIVQITTEARAGKGPGVRLLDADAPASELPSLAERLQAYYPRATIVRGPDAREACDLAEEQALAVEHALPDGGAFSVEPTRALVAVDIDVGARSGGEAKRVGRAANLAALPEIARVLRLKGLAGIVIIDLAGRGHDAEALIRAAREAFHPDNPGVQIGQVSRFGLLEVVKPWGERPRAELLLDASGGISAQTLALRLARALEREGRVQGGAQLIARVAPEVAEAFASLTDALVERLGARFTVEADPAAPRERLDVRTR